MALGTARGPGPTRRLRNPTGPLPNARASPPTAPGGGTLSCCPSSTVWGPPPTLSTATSGARAWLSWEVDRACKALVQKALPWVEHRGDFTRDSPRDVADLVLDADPNAEAMVVWCAAPPCQDFSRIAQGAGHQGDRVAFMDELRAALRSHRFAFLYENVEMSAEAAKVSSEALGVQPVFVCPSDFGWVSRPRRLDSPAL